MSSRDAISHYAVFTDSNNVYNKMLWQVKEILDPSKLNINTAVVIRHKDTHLLMLSIYWLASTDKLTQ